MPRMPTLAALLSLAAASAHAEVRTATADSLMVAFSTPVKATPAKAYEALTALPKWWDSAHTWSGKAANLSLDAQAGGCFCERWTDGSAEHGRVVMALPGKLLRIDAALGPLQEFALKGMLNFWIRSDDDGSTRLDVEYRVNGSASSGLDGYASGVDQMIGGQVARLVRYIDTGNPEAPVSEAQPETSPETAAPTIPDDTADAAAAAAARAKLLEEWKKQAEAEAAKHKPAARHEGDGP